MTLLKYLLGALLIVLILGFAFFAFIDVPVPQEEARITIQSESL